MEDILGKVQEDLNRRREYLQEALVLEKKVMELRNKAKCNSLDIEIGYIQQLIKDNIGDIDYLISLLSSICEYIGHDYVYIKEDRVFDYGIENSLEYKNLHYCRICGKAIYLDYKIMKDLDIESIRELRRVKKLR